MKETNKLNITIETKEQRDEVIKQLQEMTFKKELPKSWEEYFNSCGHVQSKTHTKILESLQGLDKKFTCIHKLQYLMEVYNDGWVADWRDTSQSKYIIYRNANNLGTDVHEDWYMFLSFKDKQTRNVFLKNFRLLIRTYFELD